MAEIRNPNQAGGSGSGTDSRSLLVMMIVTIGVTFGLQYYRAKHNPQTAPTNTALPAQTAPASAPNTPNAAAATPAAAQSSATPSVQAAAESTTVVENELYKITFSNRGGQAVSWVLKKYRDTQGQPLDLIHQGAAKLYGYPLSLHTYEPAMDQQLATALYVPSTTGAMQAPGTLSFEYSAGNLTVKKTFTFDDTYVLHADTLVTRNGAPVRALLSWPSGLGDTETAQAYAGLQIDSSKNGNEEHEAFKKIPNGNTLNGPFDWAGVSDQYFGAIFLPDSPATASVVQFHNEIDVNKVQRTNGVGQGAPAKDAKPILVPVLGAALGDTSGHTQTRIFAGPKSVDVLSKIKGANGTTLKPLLDFGFFGAIGKYLFLALRAIHAWIAPAGAIAMTALDRSWGWAIILLTILINLVLLPLRVIGMQSALKMARIQPMIDAIKAKHGNPGPTDPKAATMNAEIMQKQKDEGVNMFGGCIPTLIQLPLLFAFFAMLTKVVELRQAHFFWLPDLSAADPLHILPVVMVLSSFLVQFYTPSPGVDPQQQKMMAFMMPLFSGWMTWNYASGLALYWTVGNFIMIIQQLVMNQTALGREMRQIAEARKKKAAAGARSPKTIQGKR